MTLSLPLPVPPVPPRAKDGLGPSFTYPSVQSGARGIGYASGGATAPTFMNPTDEQLIALMGEGDEDALRELYRRYAPYLFGLARRMLGGTDDHEACVQDAFVSVWKHAARFDPARASAKTWLVTIAHRRMLQALRDRPDATLELEEWDAPQAEPNHLDKVVVQGALAVLDPEARRLIELAFYDGYSHGQLATVTGLPLGTVKTRLRTALSRLRAHLEGKREA